MEAFLGRSAFPGPAIAAEAAGAHFVGQARFSGCIAFTSWRRAEIAAFLPPEIALVEGAVASDTHPVVFVFGDQAAGAVLFAGFTVPTGAAYQELAIVVPFVRYRGGRHVHSYVPRMYSSYFPAVWHGNTHYGFAKEMALMQWRNGKFIATREDGPLLLHADTEPAGDWSPGLGTEAPNFADMRAVFAMPLVGRRQDGTYVCSYFGWDFGEAMVRPSDALVSVDAPLVPGCGPRVCHDVGAGSFEVQGMIWRLSWPAECRG